MVGSVSCIQIRSNCLIGYELPIYDSRYGSQKRANQLQQLKEAKKETYGGRLTKGAKKRMTKAIDLLVQSAKPTWGKNEVTNKRVKHTLSFITLTVSNDNNISGHQGFELIFKHFLQWMRRTANVSTYIWKAEVQQRGQLHYHITTPSWIHYQQIRNKWNTLQRSAGVTNDYYNKYGTYDPNSTDIGEVRMTADLAGYMKKEFCKSIQNPYEQKKQKIEDRFEKKQITTTKKEEEMKELELEMKGWGKLWDCSQNLKREKYYTIEESTDTYKLIKEEEKKGTITRNQLEQCTIFKVKNNETTKILNLNQIHQYDKLLYKIRNYRTNEEKKIIKTQPIKYEKIHNPLLDNQILKPPSGWQPIHIVF